MLSAARFHAINVGIIGVISFESLQQFKERNTVSYSRPRFRCAFHSLSFQFTSLTSASLHVLTINPFRWQMTEVIGLRISGKQLVLRRRSSAFGFTFLVACSLLLIKYDMFTKTHEFRRHHTDTTNIESIVKQLRDLSKITNKLQVSIRRRVKEREATEGYWYSLSAWYVTASCFAQMIESVWML